MHLRASLLARRARACLGSVALAALPACSVPVAGALDDSEANRVFFALEQANIEAVKEPDRASEGKWQVGVARADVGRALGVLRDEELPRATSVGVLDAIGKGALVPSEAAEHAQLVAGWAGDLQRSLERVDGILAARVHLNVPEPNPLREAAPARGTASVLLEHRGSTPPLSADSVQRFVAGGVSGLSPADVSVVLVSRPSPPSPAGGDLGYVGPIAVPRTSMRKLQAALAMLVAIVALLAGAVLVLSVRLSRMRVELAGRPEPKRSLP
jgi:type III secretion protein J